MKKTIIISSILIFIVGIIALLFGVVFCLRNCNIKISGEAIKYTEEEIFNASELKYGEPIFLINKDNAIAKIEKEFPDLKVVQIVTKSVVSIDIRVRNRYETYYLESTIEDEVRYYILDEELKVLDIRDEEPIDLIKLITEDYIDSNKGEFVLLDKSKLMSNLYQAVYSTMLTTEDKQSHIDMCALIKSVSFDDNYTLSGKYLRMIIELDSGIIFDIGKPEEELERKLNICFTKVREDSLTSGRITAYYNAEGEEEFRVLTD